MHNFNPITPTVKEKFGHCEVHQSERINLLHREKVLIMGGIRLVETKQF